ncbi:MAG: hypothetical protein ACO1RX_20605 [Candidatus Sericytochromatia bacterium]
MAANKLAAIFQNRTHLEQALAALQAAGFETSEVSLLFKQSEADAEFVQEDGFTERTVAQPLVAVAAPVVGGEDSLTGVPVSEVYDPARLSVSRPESEALSLQTLPADEQPVHKAVEATLVHTPEGVVVATPPEAALKDPNALVQNSALGGLLGLLGGTALLMVPGLGPVLAVGPIAAGLAALTGSAALGTTIGMMAGLLKDEGIPAERVDLYREAFDAGKGIIVLKPQDPTLLTSAHTLLQEYHPEHLEMLDV